MGTIIPKQKAKNKRERDKSMFYEWATDSKTDPYWSWKITNKCFEHPKKYKYLNEIQQLELNIAFDYAFSEFKIILSQEVVFNKSIFQRYFQIEIEKSHSFLEKDLIELLCNEGSSCIITHTCNCVKYLFPIQSNYLENFLQTIYQYFSKKDISNKLLDAINAAKSFGEKIRGKKLLNNHLAKSCFFSHSKPRESKESDVTITDEEMADSVFGLRSNSTQNSLSR